MKYDVHGRDRRHRARSRLERWERCRGASLLDVVARQPSRERRGAGERRRNRDDIRAIDHGRGVLAEDGHLRKRGREGGRHVRLVVDVCLPEARRARVTGQLRVRLKANLASERRLDLALVATSAGEKRAAELSLEEELSVEHRRRRVERNAVERRVDVVCTANGVAGGRS
jgi:hypothetical protein